MRPVMVCRFGFSHSAEPAWIQPSGFLAPIAFRCKTGASPLEPLGQGCVCERMAECANSLQSRGGGNPIDDGSRVDRRKPAKNIGPSELKTLSVINPAAWNFAQFLFRLPLAT